ncbi:MAG: hypothetical protein L0Y67_03285 [Gammaproteobacteria bacterium]|nr:hypothetical protein [Gammaproteobacteria bacterium]
MTGGIAICRPACFQTLKAFPPLAIGGLLVIFSISSSFPAAGFETVRLNLEAAEGALWRAHGVFIELNWRGDEHAELRVEIDRLELPLPIDPLAKIRLTCPQAAIESTQIVCNGGSLALKNTLLDQPQLGVAFRYGVTEGTLTFALQDGHVGGGTMRLEGHLAGQEWDVRVVASDLSAERLSEMLRAHLLWLQGYTVLQGNLSTMARASGGGSSPSRIQAQGRVTALTFDGQSAGQDVDGQFEMTLERGEAGWRGQGETVLTHGLLYIEPGIHVGAVSPGFTLEVREGPLRMNVVAEWDGKAQTLNLSHALLDHPGVVHAEGTALVLLDREVPVQMVRLRATQARLGPLYEAYLQPLLLGTSFNALDVTGVVEVDAVVESGNLSEIHLGLEHVDLHDKKGRFGIADVNGSFAYSSRSDPREGRLQWTSANIYRLEFGAGELVTLTQNRALQTVEVAFIPLLDGGLRIDKLFYQHAASDGVGLEVGGVLTPISLEAFCRVMGWPILSGKLSGIIPGINYRAKTLTINGKVLARVFDGDVVVNDLTIADLFGTVPILDTDIDFKNLDLEPLTHAFSFGRTEGRLSGAVHQLRMEDWQPVSFEARLYTPEGDHSRHRISQRAVDNLTSLGGGGASTAVSRTFLGVFKEFSYDRLGLSCRLSNGVCEMGGVAPADGGYYIVKRGFLPPWIDVKGFNREVDWTVLVGRLKAITQGGQPLIQ